MFLYPRCFNESKLSHLYSYLKLNFGVFLSKISQFLLLTKEAGRVENCFGTLEGLPISFNFVERSYEVGRIKTNIGI